MNNTERIRLLRSGNVPGGRNDMAVIYCENEAEKGQKAALERLRKKFAAKLQNRKKRFRPVPPRYDEVLFKGIQCFY